MSAREHLQKVNVVELLGKFPTNGARVKVSSARARTLMAM
jgi:hypothetical protein